MWGSALRAQKNVSSSCRVREGCAPVVSTHNQPGERLYTIAVGYGCFNIPHITVDNAIQYDRRRASRKFCSGLLHLCERLSRRVRAAAPAECSTVMGCFHSSTRTTMQLSALMPHSGCASLHDTVPHRFPQQGVLPFLYNVDDKPPFGPILPKQSLKLARTYRPPQKLCALLCTTCTAATTADVPDCESVRPDVCAFCSNCAKRPDMSRSTCG